MALQWNLTEIPNYLAVCYDHPTDNTMKPISNAMIWLCPCIDIGQWTEKNIDEVWTRIRMFERLFGPMLYPLDGGQDPTPYYLHHDQVRAHVGLWTNVAYVPRTRWLQRMYEAFDYEDRRRRAA